MDFATVMVDADSLILIGFGSILGALASLIPSYITNRATNEKDKLNSLRNLLWEMEQNKTHQETSFLIPLDDAAYRHLRDSGWLAELDVTTQGLLRQLYSFIHNKNGLVAVYLSRGGQNAVITSADRSGGVNILDVVAGLRDKINASHTDLIILLQDKLGIPRGQVPTAT